jgi:hypothetical protein
LGYFLFIPLCGAPKYKGVRLGRGRENARLFPRENKDIPDKIERDLRKLLGLATQAAPPDDAAK